MALKADACQLVIIGGGIVGLATARQLLEEHPALSLRVLEKGATVAGQQTGHNSGVIHSGLYYRPGSFKAQLCTLGRDRLYAYCQQKEIPHRRCGKVVVALDDLEVERLRQLQERGSANGLVGLRWLEQDDLRQIEPDVSGVAGLQVPQTGVVDYTAVSRQLVLDIQAAGGDVVTDCRVDQIRRSKAGFELTTTRGRTDCQQLINCAGLQSDLVARMAGIEPGMRIIPFRGEYFHLGDQGARQVRHLIYPVPDPELPFLGVHFTRSVDGQVEAGPNAVLAFSREGYRRSDISPDDLWQMLRFPGFWRLAVKQWRIGLAEWHRSLSRRRFLSDLQRLLPGISGSDLVGWGSGVRAQAVDRQGRMLDDFVIDSREGMIHVLNAPSPAATASLAIGEHVARLAAEKFDW